MHYPSFQQFRELAQGEHGAPISPVQYVPIYRRLISDSLTPVTAFHKLNDGPSACLFESVVGGEKVGRYSFLTSNPFLRIQATGRQVRVVSTQNSAEGSAKGGATEKVEEFDCPDPLAELERRLAQSRSATLPGLPPFCGGAVGYAGYDTVRYIENLPHAPPDDRGLPDMAFALYDSMIVFDNVSKTMFAIVLARVDRGQLETAYQQACRRVDELVARLATPVPDLPPVDIDTSGEPRVQWKSNFSRDDFLRAVERCLEYIRAGDIFQVVISQRLDTVLEAPPFEVYRTLRVVNPSPFMFYLRSEGVTLVGSSPEILVRVVNGQITTRPLAGTRPRGANDEEDRALAAELLADPKERAEHVMLVDLGRNDVGRVARFGSVDLTDVMTVERYSHVMHITSNVAGQLADGKTAFDALRACLPAGTVSGAPKVRAMQIIDELEPHRRGPYAGAVGYIDFNGNMDTCIALRTMVLQGNRAYIQAGAGIVADSQAATEYQETLSKARGLLKAIEITQRRCGS